MDLSPFMAGGDILYTLVAFVVAISVIVAVHEYGHYIVGRWCGIKAEKFSLGFGPVIFSRVDKHGTQWQLAALPFGGYVKFLGDANAASGMDGEALARVAPEMRESTMYGAKLWKRSATVAAGPIFNFIFSILVFAAIFMVQGQPTPGPVVGQIQTLPTAVQGLQNGDAIIGVEGTSVADYVELYDALDELDPAPVLRYEVLRDGDRLLVDGPFGFPPLVGALQPQSAAMASDLKVGDVIVAIDGTPVYSFRELREMVAASEGAELTLDVWREGEEFQTTLAPKRTDLPKAEGGFETRWLIGVTGSLVFEPETVAVAPHRAIYGGFLQTWNVITGSISGIYHIIQGEISTCNLQGPVGIAQISGQAASQGAQSFIWIIAVLSTAVGLLNLFPIPVLDGGHLVFHAYEAVTRRMPAEWAMRAMMSAGLTLILGFMVFALTNDFFCP